MRVLHVAPAYYPATCWGGPVFSVYELNNALARLPDIALTVLTTDAAGPRASERLDMRGLDGLYPGQEVVVTRRLAGASVSLELLRRLPMLVRRADVVHLTAAYSFPVIPTLLLCRILGKPLVWSPRGAIQDAHEWEGTRRRTLKRWWEKLCNALLASGKTAIHVTSERECAATQGRLARASAVVVPNGVSVPADPAARDWRPHGRLRLMYLGRLSPKKGVENLLEAMRLLGDVDVSLSIYGSGEDGYVDGLKSLARRLDLPEGKVAFAGQADGADRELAFARADICVVPSHTENFCMVVAEALARGVPVIASTGTPWQAVEDRQCGLWVKNAPRSLADAITGIGHMDLEQMGMRGRAWMREEFGWDAIALAMRAAYEKTMGSRA
jgi:glycosyltransferase involved in cell wall biosynthesis